MKESKSRVETFLIRAMCDQPGCDGEMTRNNPGGISTVLTTYPPRYAHYCNKCGHVETFTEIYPKTVYEEVAYGKTVEIPKETSV